MMNNHKNLLTIVIAVIILAALYFLVVRKNNNSSTVAPQTNQANQTNRAPTNSNKSAVNASNNTAQKSKISEPISNALSRVTKKPFGIYITKQNSPVQPERFSGYHTGVDFETTSEEQNIDVPIIAICSGKLLVKRTATGYGGVAVEACKIDGADVTVIYGHVKLASIQTNAGGQLTAGQQFAVLGKGYSSETDGERKHLHLGIHKGTSINILGYVQKQGDLNQWLDAAKYL